MLKKIKKKNLNNFHDALNQNNILFVDLNYNVNVVMGASFGNSRISIKEVVLTLIF